MRVSLPTSLLLVATLVLRASAAVDFDTEIVPLLTKSGCNAGACHGAAAGRGGFRLSLFGGDPAFDYRSVVQELEGRRVNLAHPEQSLVLLKGTETIEHGGGTRFNDDDPPAVLLRDWITQGAPRLQSRQLVDCTVSPGSRVIEDLSQPVPLSSRATFDDGTERDVTLWTVFTAEDPAAVEIDPRTAVAAVHRPGRHVIISRYLGQVQPLVLIAPLSDAALDLDHESRVNFIDEEVLVLLETLRIPPSGPAGDREFLRRVTLDLTGRLPTSAAVDAYASDGTADKRSRLIDRLLASPEFTEFWTWRFATLLRIRTPAGEPEASSAYHAWLSARIANATPLDRFARDLLLAMGDSHTSGPANFYRTVAGPREQAEFVSELFLGSRLRCANCHNHPLDAWTQDDYHGLASIFARVTSGRVVGVAPRGEVIHPATGEPARPRIPGERFLADEDDGRLALAAWLTDPSNRSFSRATVNRLWKALFGRGLVEPTDDLRTTNPATHPKLLDRLASDFVEHGYDLRHTLRLIANSAAYARGSRTNAANQSDDRYYSHALVRALEPEVLADALSDVLGTSTRFGALPLGTRAVAVIDPGTPSETLDVLGRCSRAESCESASGATGGLPRTLHLFNGGLLNDRIGEAGGRLARLLAEGRSGEEIAAEFTTAALGRPTTPAEEALWKGELAGAGSAAERRQVLEDAVWALCTCREFTTNH